MRSEQLIARRKKRTKPVEVTPVEWFIYVLRERIWQL